MFRLDVGRNLVGRDFVCGDLHGCYGLLMNSLEDKKFDFGKDRLFCTGDLIDRGPDSPKCVGLLNEPWFFSVQGNHERMFFSYILDQRSLTHRSNDFIRNDGGWVFDLSVDRLREFAFLMQEKMPISITVGDSIDGFTVTHSGHCLEDTDESIDDAVWDRSITNEVYSKEIKCGEFSSSDSVIMLGDFDENKQITYVGHNINKNRNIIVVDNTVMVDTGAFLFEHDKTMPYGLTVIEHSEFLSKIRNLV